MTKVSHGSISAGGHDVYVDIEVEGSREKIVEMVAMHAKDEAVRAMQAFDTGKPPEDCDGSGVSIRWETVLEDYSESGE